MAAIASQQAVSTASIPLITHSRATAAAGDYSNERFLLKNRTGTGSVFLGGADVTTATGFEWEPLDGALEIELEPSEVLYAVAASAQTIHVLRLGR